MKHAKRMNTGPRFNQESVLHLEELPDLHTLILWDDPSGKKYADGW